MSIRPCALRAAATRARRDRRPCRVSCPSASITTTAAQGYSSYGNQIGLATGKVAGSLSSGLCGQAHGDRRGRSARHRADNVRRERPAPGDIVILLGGRTGRDGCGGATGSSKAHNDAIADDLRRRGAEGQSRRPSASIQRLFRNAEVCTADQALQRLRRGRRVRGHRRAGATAWTSIWTPCPRNTRVWTARSWRFPNRRSAWPCVHASRTMLERFIAAGLWKRTWRRRRLPSSPRKHALRMHWSGKTIVDLTRAFLDTNGVTQHAEAEGFRAGRSRAVSDRKTRFREKPDRARSAGWQCSRDLNICSQKGLVERFDGTIGAGTILMPYGGEYQRQPERSDGRADSRTAGETTTATLMSLRL